MSVPLFTSVGKPALARPAAATKQRGVVIDEPMRRLRLPKGAVGRDYVLMQLNIGSTGPLDFMVDSGLTAELITPHLRQQLRLPPSTQRLANGLGAGGAVQGGELVTLKGERDAALVGAEERRLPLLTAVVTDFIQEHLDPSVDVEGMLGMERLRLWEPGAGAAAAEAAGLAELPAAVLNETGILGIRATSTAARRPQPFAGIVDCGASFSALNWQAAALAGLPPRGDSLYNKGPTIYGVGIDGAPQQLPTAPVSFTYTGNVVPGTGRGTAIAFEAPAAGWKPWAPVLAAIGDLPVFSQLLGDGRTPFEGPAALIGLDVWAQRRVVIGAGVGQRGRARRLFVSKK